MTATARLRVDPIACAGRGLCAEMLPELIRLDDWGFPIITDEAVPPHLATDARETVRACPKLALRLTGHRPGRAQPRSDRPDKPRRVG
ncbi:MAG: ferredoxin [Actinomycetota bacterium]|nr:ferredoxin [Actinomycetota bacterium]